MSTPGAEYGRSYTVTDFCRQLPEWRHEPEQGAVTTNGSPFTLIFNGVSDLLFLIGVEPGPQFRCLLVNHSNLMKTGRTREQLEGKLIEEILPPEQAQFTIAKYTAAVQARGPITYEESVTVTAGQLIVETTLTPVFDEQGNCTHLLGNSRDVTERQRMVKGLQESETRYRNLFENARDALATFTLDGTITAVNRAAERLIGWSRAELVGQHVSKVATLASVALAEERTQHFLAGKQLPSSIFEAELIHKDGSVILVEARTSVMRNAAGEPIGFQGSYRDITKRRQAEETSQRLAAIVESSDDAIISKSLHGIVTSWNAAAERLFGYRAEEMIGKPIFCLLPEDRYGEGRMILERIGQGECMDRFETIRRTKDGRFLDVSLTLSPLRNKDGTIIGVSSIARNITERKNAERALQESEERYRMISQSISDYAFSFFMNDRGEPTLEWLTDSFTQITGYPVSELLGKPNTLSHYVHPEDLNRILCTIRNLQPGKPSSYEFRIIRKDGAVRWLQSRVQAIADETGKLMRLYGAAHDITERKLMDTALRESEQRYRAVVDTQTELICRFRPDTTLTFVNEAYCRYFGKSREELLGTKFLSLIPKYAQPAAKAHIDSLSADPRLVIDEHEVIAAGGEHRWQQWTDQAIVDGTGQLIEFQSTGLDITERRQAEGALQQLQEELAHVSRVISMGEMAASIAHEVNQPLGAIVGNADICLRWLDSEAPDLDQVREALSDIIKDGHRASEVIARIRALVKNDASQKTFLNINEVVREAYTLASHEAQRKGVRLRIELSSDLPRIFGDRVQLGQVMLNLIMNGIEAMSGVAERARKIILRSGRNGAEKVLITVQDHGVGVDPQEAKHIFAPFHTTKPGGMGMGLAICRSIIDAHGGRLWVAPNAGPGATFQFTLPCNKKEGK